MKESLWHPPWPSVKGRAPPLHTTRVRTSFAQLWVFASERRWWRSDCGRGLIRPQGECRKRMGPRKGRRAQNFGRCVSAMLPPQALGVSGGNTGPDNVRQGLRVDGAPLKNSERCTPRIPRRDAIAGSEASSRRSSLVSSAARVVSSDPARERRPTGGTEPVVFRALKHFWRRRSLARHEIMPQCAVPTWTAGARSGVWTVCPDGLGPDSVVYSFGVGDNADWELCLI